MQVITIGLDIAKSAFQVHGEDASGKIVIEKRLRRSQVAFFHRQPNAPVGIEACGTAHYWGRSLRALATSEVRLIPAAGAGPRAGRGRTRGSNRLSGATTTMRAMPPRSAPRWGGRIPSVDLGVGGAAASRR
jgi:transposase